MVEILLPMEYMAYYDWSPGKSVCLPACLTVSDSCNFELTYALLMSDEI
jgi:hypothetical protein